ncbi:hypothetical protein ACFX15_012622 [Malus domestica]
MRRSRSYGDTNDSHSAAKLLEAREISKLSQKNEGRRSRSPSRGSWSRFLLCFDMERMEVLAVLLDKFFDMEYPDCVKAFDAYASAIERIEKRGERVWWVGVEERIEG